MSFANLKRNRNAIDQLVKAAEATNTTQSSIPMIEFGNQL